MAEAKDVKKCPKCKEEIANDATKCKHCGADLRNWFIKHKIMTGILAIIALVVVVQIANSGNKSSTPASADKTSTTTTSAKAATPQVLLDLSGSGTKTTQKFTAAGDWDLAWSYDCSSFGSQGNFMVSPTGDGLLTPVNQLGNSGSDVEHYHSGGTYYLEINSECSWHVTAKG